MADGDIDMFMRVQLNVAVPLYIKVAWEKKVPKQKRSITLAQMVAKYCKVVDPVKRQKELKGKE